MGRRARLTATAGALFGIAWLPAPAGAADPVDRRFGYGVPPAYADPGESDLPPLPRYFPREGSDSSVAVVPERRRIARGCRPRRVPIPTDAPDDPSYVGSTYGLGKPSYYGFVPALGTDDPFGRSILPYCR
ncbi:hypothetical protein [Methylobacterium sp. Leaf466]|uniref:hypothetical protein n=1 Tax=Methylobacterium sp. Leaf466 TaxID=1736386 RepID=UPI000B04CF7F|nr:hypothetical protein [Methylobacterium sp. Leaf466]